MHWAYMISAFSRRCRLEQRGPLACQPSFHPSPVKGPRNGQIQASDRSPRAGTQAGRTVEGAGQWTKTSSSCYEGGRRQRYLADGGRYGENEWILFLFVMCVRNINLSHRFCLGYVAWSECKTIKFVVPNKKVIFRTWYAVVQLHFRLVYDIILLTPSIDLKFIHYKPYTDSRKMILSGIIDLV